MSDARACVDLEAGELLVQCDCGGVRPSYRPCGWRRPLPAVCLCPKPDEHADSLSPTGRRCRNCGQTVQQRP